MTPNIKHELEQGRRILAELATVEESHFVALSAVGHDVCRHLHQECRVFMSGQTHPDPTQSWQREQLDYVQGLESYVLPLIESHYRESYIGQANAQKFKDFIHSGFCHSSQCDELLNGLSALLQFEGYLKHKNDQILRQQKITAFFDRFKKALSWGRSDDERQTQDR